MPGGQFYTPFDRQVPRRLRDKAAPVLCTPERTGRAVDDLSESPDHAYLETVPLGARLRHGFDKTQPFRPVIKAMTIEMAVHEPLEMDAQIARSQHTDQNDAAANQRQQLELRAPGAAQLADEQAGSGERHAEHAACD